MLYTGFSSGDKEKCNEIKWNEIKCNENGVFRYSGGRVTGRPARPGSGFRYSGASARPRRPPGRFGQARMFWKAAARLQAPNVTKTGAM